MAVDDHGKKIVEQIMLTTIFLMTHLKYLAKCLAKDLLSYIVATCINNQVGFKACLGNSG